MNNLYQSSTLIKPKDIESYVQPLLDNKTIIINNGNHYVFATHLFNTTEIYKILQLKHVEDTQDMGDTPVCLCKGFYDSSILLELTSVEKKLYKMLTHTFWPGELNICVRAKTFINDIATYTDHFIIMNSPNHPHIQKILETTNIPLITYLTNKIGHIPHITHSQVSKEYFNESFPILDTTQHIGAIHNTTIMIHNNTITLMQKGRLQFNDIKEYILSGYDNAIEFNTRISEQKKYTHIQPIYAFKLIDFDIDVITPSILSELQSSTQTLIEQTILIDFNHIHMQYRQLFYGYIDISETGQIEEFEQNIYNVLHTIKSTECTRIYVTDIKHMLSNHPYIYSLIDTLTDNKNIVIPYPFLKNN